MLIQFKRQVINGSETYPKKFKWEPSKYAQRNANKMKERHLQLLFLLMWCVEGKTPSSTISSYLCDV
jgi:hypothetical protein